MNIPATWKDLVERGARGLGPRLRGIRATVKSASEPGGLPLIDPFRGLSILLAEALALRGPTACREHFALLTPLAPAAYEFPVDPSDFEVAYWVDGALWFSNLAQTSGHDFPGAFGERQMQWLEAVAPQAQELETSVRHSLAFSALAFAQDRFVPRFLLQPNPPPEPGRAFQFNYPSLVGYLSAACQVRADYSAIEPAWIDFLRSFPYKLASGTIDWPHLFCLGRTVYHRVQGLPVAEAARETHKQIMQLVGQGY